MLQFFTNPYPNELLYSAISRYHFYIGNVSFVETLEELFQSRTIVPNIEFVSHLSTLIQKLGGDYSVEKLLSENTIYPFYAPFITMEKQEKVFEDVLGNGQGLHGRLGVSSSKVGKKKGVFFCSICAREDIENFREPYIHREHQLPAIDYCPHHEQLLTKYPIDYKVYSRHGYIRFDKRIMDLSIPEDNETKEFKKIQVKLSKMAYKLLNTPINRLSLEVVFGKYRTLLRDGNWIMKNSAVRQEDLLNAFNSKFPKGFLKKFNSDINVKGENKWLQSMITNYKRQGIHPFRHLLLLYFFDQDIDSFLTLKEDEGPFGKGPWPCLNKAAKHYKEFVISEVKISKREKTNIIIGKFTCSCGFEYTRMGPEKDESEKWIKSRITAYGEEWEAKFDELINMNMRPEEVALELDISPSTVRNKVAAKTTSIQLTKKYRAELLKWKGNFPDSNRKQFQTELKKTFTYLYENDKEWLDINLPSQRVCKLQEQKLMEKYRSLLLKEIKRNPNISRTRLWRKYNRACKYLYANDLDWYSANFPPVKKIIQNTSPVDWAIRDKEYYGRINEIYPELLMLEKPVRITRTLFSKRLNIFILSIKNYMDKLPNTNVLLNEITETVKEFQIRRCSIAIDKMLEDAGIVRFEAIRETCAISTKHFKEIKPDLEEYVMKKQRDLKA